MPEMAAECGAEEAALRYRAIVVTTLRQIKGVPDLRLRILPEPDDAAEALRFWLLPRLADRWQMEGAIFRSDGWEIDFGGENEHLVEASGEILCPYLGARWVHAALLGLERGGHRVVGPSSDGSEVFRARALNEMDQPEIRVLPELPVIRNGPHWRDALDGPLGPSLKRALQEESWGA